MEIIIQQEVIEGKIYITRGHKVMLSTDLAELYKVEPRVLVQAVKRNMERFPADFMFQLNDTELDNLKSQIVISSWGGPRRATPYAFTEQGVAMLSSVLHSKRAVQVNIRKKTEMITAAIARTLGPFRVADIQRECHGVSMDMIRQVLKTMKASGQVECLGRGQNAQWQKMEKRN